jgi:hypothetical protein
MSTRYSLLSTDLKDSLNKRIGDLSRPIDAEFKNVHQRIDRLESPVGRK